MMGAWHFIHFCGPLKPWRENIEGHRDYKKYRHMILKWKDYQSQLNGRVTT